MAAADVFSLNLDDVLHNLQTCLGEGGLGGKRPVHSSDETGRRRDPAHLPDLVR